MTPIGRINQAKAAQVFCDFLRAQGVDADWLPDDSGMQVVRVFRAEQAVRAQQFLREFLQNPADPRFTQGAWTHGRAQDPAHVDDSGMSALGQRLLQGAGPLTLAVMAITVLTAFWTQLGENRRALYSLLFSLPEIFRGDLHRLLAPVFVHFTALHLLFNLMWWWQLGGVIEKRLGSLALLKLFAIAAVLPNLAQYVWGGPYFGGLSGVVYGLFGYVWWRGRREAFWAAVVPSGVAVFMFAWLVLCMTGWLGPVANAAHLAGLASGVAWARWNEK